MIELVFFDAGGTLIDPEPNVGAVYARAGRAHGLTADPPVIQAAFRSAWRRHEANRRLVTDDRDETHTFWRGVVFEVFDEVGFTGDREACYRSLFSVFEQPDSWRVYDDVEPVLDALATRGVRAGVISNWDYRLVPLLDALGLTPRFDPILVSCHEGVAKPDVALFRRASARAGVPPDRILHVGDREALDVAPARAAGFEALLLDRSRTTPGAIGRLTELLSHLPDGNPAPIPAR